MKQKHFTIEQAEKVLENSGMLKWDGKTVMDSLQKRVWYNVLNMSDGDIVFWVNHYPCDSKRKCINFVINLLGNINNKDFAYYLIDFYME